MDPCLQRQLKGARDAMASSPAFASAMSTSLPFDDCLKAACTKAVEAMPGANPAGWVPLLMSSASAT